MRPFGLGRARSAGGQGRAGQRRAGQARTKRARAGPMESAQGKSCELQLVPQSALRFLSARLSTCCAQLYLIMSRTHQHVF